MSVGLVLEGGGTRGWYTGGVLTVLNENHIYFPIVYGVSAGALNALSYISRQINRDSAAVYMGNMKDKRYMSMRNLQRTGSFFNFDYILGELPRKTPLPFDYETFCNSPTDLKVGATDIKTGKSVYFNKCEMGEDYTAVKASCSLPFLANIVEYRGHSLLDGGCSEPIPIECSIRDGNEKNVIVMTQDDSYREKPGSKFSISMLHRKYNRYPDFVSSMKQHARIYNDEVALCMRLEREGKAIVIRPKFSVVLRRYNDTKPLIQMYQMGIYDCRERLQQISRFLS